MILSDRGAPLLKAEAITMRYRRWRSEPVAALSDVSFDLRAGTVLGLLGSNGAGKTTLLHVIMGFVRPSAGRGTLFGVALGDERGRRRIGFLAEEFSFHRRLTVHDLMIVQDRLAGFEQQDRDARIRRALERLDLTSIGERRFGALSKGTRQLVGIAQATLGEPELLILDEPASGLDPVGRGRLASIIDEWRTSDRAVLFSTHVIADAERLCNRVVVLHQGRLRFDGLPSDLAGTVGGLDFETAVIETLKSRDPVIPTSLYQPVISETKPVDSDAIPSSVGTATVTTGGAFSSARILGSLAFRLSLGFLAAGAGVLVGLAGIAVAAAPADLTAVLYHQFYLVATVVALCLGVVPIHFEHMTKTIFSILSRPVPREAVILGRLGAGAVVLLTLGVISVLIDLVLVGHGTAGAPGLFATGIGLWTVAAVATMGYSQFLALVSTPALSGVFLFLVILAFGDPPPRLAGASGWLATVVHVVAPPWDAMFIAANLRLRRPLAPDAAGLLWLDGLTWVALATALSIIAFKKKQLAHAS